MTKTLSPAARIALDLAHRPLGYLASCYCEEIRELCGLGLVTIGYVAAEYVVIRAIIAPPRAIYRRPPNRRGRFSAPRTQSELAPLFARAAE
jgi:hypothetical protein